MFPPLMRRIRTFLCVFDFRDVVELPCVRDAEFAHAHRMASLLEMTIERSSYNRKGKDEKEQSVV